MSVLQGKGGCRQPVNCRRSVTSKFMTRVTGYRIVGTPCCGATFKRPQYASVSYYVDEYWTDGFLAGNSAVGEDGLRRCICGKVYLMHTAIETGLTASEQVPSMIHLGVNDLAEVLAQGMDPALEIAVRRSYWHQLNHPYRGEYRAHRKDVDAVAERLREDVPKVKPSAIQRFKALFAAPPPPPPAPQRRAGPFTVPPYQPTEQQHRNMARLIELELKNESVDWVEVSELYREMGLFDAAAKAISRSRKEETMTSKLIRELITEKETCPMRHS